MQAVKRIIQGFIHFFPVQLLVLNFKKHQVLLIFWALFFMTVIGKMFTSYGIPYLFLDPEYLGQSGYQSFALVGIAFGAFIVTWNLVLYKLNSFRFPFLASLRWPLATFSLNNLLIPLVFLGGYVISIYRFQRDFELVSDRNLMLDILGFLAGLVVMVLINAAYFQFANKDLIAIVKQKKRAFKLLKRSYYRKRDERFEDLQDTEATFKVDYYVSNRFRIKRCRNVDHYDPELLDEVFKQHHWNAILIQFVSIVTILILGVFIENPFFQIPAAASVFIAFAVFTSLYGLFKFWTGKWSSTAFIIGFILVNVITKYNYLTYQSMAYGLDYNKPPEEYSIDALNKIATDKNIHEDIASTTRILENWKKKNTTGKKGKKPKIIMVCASGGGLRAAMFSTAIMQRADSMTNGQLMDHTVLMTGASGGMMGMSYIRELYYRKQLGEQVAMYDKQRSFDVAKDLINAMNISIITNDIFYPWRSLRIRDNYYKKDRGYMFEQQFIKNTGNIMTRNLHDYVKPERDATIPMMIDYPVITNDARFLIIGSQQMRYMMKPYEHGQELASKDVDAIDYLSFFADYHPYDMPVTTAVRMNATYPWILPNVIFPTDPLFNVMDAGIRDNFGISMFYRFSNVFQDWILKNTDGVVIVELRAVERSPEIEPVDRRSFLSKLLSPLGTLPNNISTMHDYQNDNLLSMLHEKLGGKLEIIRFAYVPDKKSARASMSFRLTTKEKNEIMNSVDRPNNTRALQQLIRVF